MTKVSTRLLALTCNSKDVQHCCLYCFGWIGSHCCVCLVLCCRKSMANPTYHTLLSLPHPCVSISTGAHQFWYGLQDTTAPGLLQICAITPPLPWPHRICPPLAPLLSAQPASNMLMCDIPASSLLPQPCTLRYANNLYPELATVMQQFHLHIRYVVKSSMRVHASGNLHDPPHHFAGVDLDLMCTAANAFQARQEWYPDPAAYSCQPGRS